MEESVSQQAEKTFRGPLPDQGFKEDTPIRHLDPAEVIRVDELGRLGREIRRVVTRH
jgi:hypothetical protein